MGRAWTLRSWSFPKTLAQSQTQFRDGHRRRVQGDLRRAEKLLPRIPRVFGNLKTWHLGTHYGVGVHASWSGALPRAVSFGVNPIGRIQQTSDLPPSCRSLGGSLAAISWFRQSTKSLDTAQRHGWRSDPRADVRRRAWGTFAAMSSLGHLSWVRGAECSVRKSLRDSRSDSHIPSEFPA